MKRSALSIAVLFPLLAGFSTCERRVEMPPLPATYRSPCHPPEDLPETADLGDVLGVASLNALHLVECEKRRGGTVVWVDEQMKKQ